MIPYLVKSSLMLIVLYGCFMALLGKETFYRLNRIVILSIITSVLIIPALNITLPKPDYINIWDEELSYTPITHEHINHIPLNIADEEASTEATQMPIIPNDEQIPIEYHEEPTPFPWQKIIIGIYLLGLAWRVGLFVWQILLFRREIKRGLHQKDQYGNKITILSGDFVPYSFFHHIVISAKDYEQLRTPILVHEQAHARLGHSWDIMLLEILCAIQWFNPFCHMLARELRCVHEYEADNEVLNHGIDATQYQQLLVIKAVGKHLQSFANNFNRNSLKKRIIMMNKQKSNKRLMYRGLFLPLVLVIAVIAYAKPKIESHMGDNCIELFPIDTAQLNSAYRTLSINPDNKEAQEQFFNAFPKNWSEFIITYQYDDSEDYDLTMYFLADDHITTLGEKLTLIDKYTYYKRLISLGIGGSWDADAPNYLQRLLHSKMKENTTTMLECLSQLDREKQLQFWTFYWSYGHCRDTEITDPEYNLLLTENEAKFPIAMETMKQVYTADEESKKQVQNTINEIHSKAERMARSGQRNSSKLTEEYATQEFKDIYNLVDTWGKQHNTALIPYDCWLRLYNANSPTYTAQEIDVYHHNGRQLASITQIITDTINGRPISHKSVVFMTPIDGKWKVFDFQDFDEPSYTELVKLAHKEALLAKEKSKENTQEGQTENNTELEDETLTPTQQSTLNQLPDSKAACYINDIFVKSFVGINPLVEADTKVEINKIALSTPITINGVEYQTKFVLKTDKKFNLVSLDEVRQQYYPNVTGKVIYMINSYFITSDTESYKVDKDFIHSCEILNSSDIDILNNGNASTPFTIIKIITKNNKPHVRIRGDREESKDTSVYVNNEESAKFPGGEEALEEYFKAELNFANKSTQKVTNNRIILRFLIETDGTISDIEIVRSTGSKRIDKEVAKVIQKMPRWKPASENGSPIKSWYHLAIPLKKYGLEEKQERQGHHTRVGDRDKEDNNIINNEIYE